MSDKKEPQSKGRKGSSRQTKVKYTDVIIVGNGPSAITLSYLLAGNWPYYTGEGHSDEYLHMRASESPEKSLIEQDLDFLSDGLEGRTSNPVSLLLDALTHPDADLGMEHPSLLSWQHHDDREIPHIIVGKNAPGGAWQVMDGKMQTLSLGNWMELPNMPFKEYVAKQALKRSGGSNLRQDRASIHDVRSYYQAYIRKRGLAQFFQSHSTVVSVERVLDVQEEVDDESGEVMCKCDNIGGSTDNQPGCCLWEVRGFRQMVDIEGEEPIKEEFCIRAPNIVLASGTYDLPNRLGVPGENNPYIIHSLSELEKAVVQSDVSTDSDPLMIIGAGLSAADAILYARTMALPIVHVFRRDAEDPGVIFNKLPSKVYPEYHSIHTMMKGERGLHDGYENYPTHSVIEFMADNKVLLGGKDSCDRIIQVSRVLILIGSRPNLSYLSQEGRNLGIVPKWHIDCKHNPLDVDPFTNQSVHEPGLYAMGPLVGENFVRFLQGGALAITNHLWQKKSGTM